MVLHVGVLVGFFVGIIEARGQGSRIGLSGDYFAGFQQFYKLPEPITNAAVATYAFKTADYTPYFAFQYWKEYIYVFGGMDSTLSPSGIHKRCYKINEYGVVQRLPDIPDSMGVIASSASTIGDFIYVVGGYHVFPDSSEVSSKRIHEFDVIGDTFTSRRIEIPIAIDDHVQIVYKDLLYIISGWSNTRNVSAVQVYDTKTNQWSWGTILPPSITPVFGASGGIIGNKIYFLGGARSDQNYFPTVNQICVGEIDTLNPNNISWSTIPTTFDVSRYRSSCIRIKDNLIWFNGSKSSYNFSPHSYKTDSLVTIDSSAIRLDETGELTSYVNISTALTDAYNGIWDGSENMQLFMDNRDFANGNRLKAFNDRRGTSGFIQSFYTVGGINNEGKVSDQITRIFEEGFVGSINESGSMNSFQLHPNPATSEIHVRMNDQKTHSLKILEIRGNEVLSKQISTEETVDISDLKAGVYFVVIDDAITKKLIKK